MRRFFLLMILAGACLLPAQEIKLKMNAGKGETYTYLNKPFPKGMLVYTLDKQKQELKVDQLTLIQVFGTCCGIEPETWFKVRELEETYKDRGLKTVAISFENGSSLKEHQKVMRAFFEERPKPEHYFMDHLGYVIEDLGVPAFPTYFLVSAEGNVILRVYGKDDKAVRILEEEINNHL